MVVRWDIAAFVVAFLTMFVSASPAALSIIQKTARDLVCLLWPARGRCRRFSWDDVQDGLLHMCDPRGTCSHGSHPGKHMTTNCWDQTIGHIFNRAWFFMNSDSNTKTFVVKKPSQLALGEDYVQTDIETLKAYLLLTTDASVNYETTNIATSLRVRRASDLITVHLPVTRNMPANIQLTKFEMERILQGYPPFFRESLTTTGGITLPFPITASDDIARGAWILAVGMTTTLGPIPALHYMQRLNKDKPDAYWKGTLVLTAFNMIGQALMQIKEYEEQDKFKMQNEQARYCDYALSCVRMMMSSEYSSQPWTPKKNQIEGSKLFEDIMSGCPCHRMCICPAEHTLDCGRDQHTKKMLAKSLTKDQCTAAFQIFNNYQHSHSNLKMIRPVYRAIFQCLILGMSEVEHYFSSTRRKLELPVAVTEQKYIYLRRCEENGD